MVIAAQCSHESDSGAAGLPTRLQTRIRVYPDSQPCSQSPRPLGRALPPSGIDAQRTPGSPLPPFVIATLVAQISVLAEETQSGLRSGPFSASRLLIWPRMALCDPAK